MLHDSAWREERTRSPSVILDDGIRGFLEEKTAHLFATQLQSRLDSLEQTREAPRFLRRNSYNLYLEGHFALVDPRDLERTTLSPTPPSSDEDWTTSEHTPEPNPKTNQYKAYLVENLFSRSKTLQGRVERKSLRRRSKKSSKTTNQNHRMLRRSRDKPNSLFYELDWVGRNAVAVCQLAQDSSEMATKKG
ncbi:uncharacterized protein Z519_07274 [Cladophialophora bantiana CBS 173.52]|uniref:Uncharacterized protein n=1 Tax=Cladophialophora bantiana (strain ATCC 10958 / CBS 173.52 / CDC B-1940 / NIH 8579) TaxID=1442370 RepID=A0A0D2HN72_CLAB1|nr:uncharacterized protein Z519_07274 [Cladophialophora bantiana CBS 173.52]KIW92290.1 hypothetical protein Z519_07274 [Cladophialophora bantiana CBS 173.52]